MQQKDPLRRAERNQAIITLYLAGRTSPQLAEGFGLSDPRICQILNQAGVKMRGRRKAITPEQCEASFQAFAAARVGKSINAYTLWQRENPWAVSPSSMRNHGYTPRLKTLPAKNAVPRLPTDLPAPSRVVRGPILTWLSANGCETHQEIERVTGATFRPAFLAARRPGFQFWSASHLDRLFPDLWTLNRSCA